MVDDAMAHRPHKIDGREVESKRAVPRDVSILFIVASVLTVTSADESSCKRRTFMLKEVCQQIRGTKFYPNEEGVERSFLSYNFQFSLELRKEKSGQMLH